MTQSTTTLEFTTALLIGLLLGSFVEYTVHRPSEIRQRVNPNT